MTEKIFRKIGFCHFLPLSRVSAQGIYLLADDFYEILLPNKFVDKGELKEEYYVFVYNDSEDRLVATTEKPFALRNQIVSLTVVDTNAVGAFVDWGLSKDLLVPFSEQKKEMQMGQSYLVRVCYDENTNRLYGSTKLEKYLKKENKTYSFGDPVDLLVWQRTPKGWKVILDEQYLGMLFQNDVKEKIRPGQELSGYIGKLREDRKLDVVLDPPGYDSVKELSNQVLEKLQQHKGRLPYGDKSDPEVIKKIFGVSKKKYKQAVGALLKEKKIRLDDNGIRLIK